MVIKQPYQYEFYDFEKELPTESIWDLHEYEQESYRDVELRNGTYGRVRNPRYDRTKMILSYIKKKVSNGKDHVIITITGQTGKGKSRVAQVIAHYIAKFTHVPLTIKDITFTNEELLSRAEVVKKNSTIIKDEHILGAGLGAEREKGEMLNVENTLRRFGLNLIFCAPIEMEHATAHLDLEVIAKSKASYGRFTKLAIRRNGRYLGFMILPIPEDKDDKLWREYDAESIGNKDKFIDAIKSRQLKRVDYKATAETVKKHPLYKRFGKFIRKPTVYFILRDQNPNLTDKEIAQCFIAYCSYIGLFRKKELTKKIKKYLFCCPICDGSGLGYSKVTQKQSCRKCGWQGLRDEAKKHAEAVMKRQEQQAQAGAELIEVGEEQ